MRHTLATWFDRHRLAVVIAVLLITLCAAIGLTRLRFNSNLRDLFRADSGHIERMEELYAQFGSDDAEGYVVVRGEDVFAGAAARALREVTAVLAEGPWRVRSLVSPAPRSAPGLTLLPAEGAEEDEIEAMRRTAQANPLIAGRLVSADSRSALVVVSLSREHPLASGSTDELVRRLGGYDPPDGVEVVLTGLPVIRRELLLSMGSDQVLFFVLGNVAGMTVALVLFRSLVPVVLCTMSAMLGTAWTLGALGLVGEPLNPVNAVITDLVLIIGFTDSVHLVFEARRGIGEGLTPRQGAVRALARIGPACFLTSLTTAIGLASLAFTNQELLRRFGIAAAGGACLTFLAVITVLPLALGTGLGRRLGRPRLDWVQRPSRPVVAPLNWLLRHARSISIVGIVLTGVLVLGAMRARPDALVREAIPSGADAARGIELIDESFGGMLSTLVLVQWDEGLSADAPEVRSAVAEVGQAIREESMFGPVLSHVAIGGGSGDGAISRLLGAHTADLRAGLVREDLRRALVRTSLPDVGAAAHAAPLSRLASTLRAIESRHPGVRLTLAGNPIAIGQAAEEIIRNMLVSLGLAGIIIVVVIGISERSLVLGVLSVIPNAIPILAVLAVLGAVGRQLDLTAVVALCVCLGIAVDDTIHVLTWTRREHERLGQVAPAVRASMLGVGSALVTTTAILIGGFSATLISSMPLIRVFGGLAMIAMAVALAGDLILLPALIAWLWRPRATPAAAASSDPSG
ncbi:MAG: MMPL family transporter [Phycisphaeraceae bacterium]|nr:MMPL family transporter [Phycisphaeraceae bacterium]